MKLDEVFDEHYYDYLQDEMQRKKYDPMEDRPETDTEMAMQDFIISAFEAGEISYDEAKKRLIKSTPDPFEQKFWRMELAMADELMND